MATVVNTTFKLKRGEEARWIELNPILQQGEPGFVYDKNRLKIGDGVTPWNDLPYIDGKSAVESYNSRINFPEKGNPEAIYKAFDELGLYQFNSEKNIYEKINNNTTYEIAPLKKEEEICGIQVQTKENGIISGEPLLINFDVYTKNEIGILPENQTLVEMIESIKNNSGYDDTELRDLITAEENRATAVENAIEGRLNNVETFFAAIETPDETIDTLAEIVHYIEEDKVGVSNMLNNISSNTSAIEAINDPVEGLLSKAKNYTDEKINNIPVATDEKLGLVKYDNVTIKKNELNQLYINQISTDILVNGENTLIINGGSGDN